MRRGVAVGLGLLVLAGWGWTGTWAARAKHRWMVERWPALSMDERARCYASPLRVGTDLHGVTARDLSKLEAVPEEEWSLDLFRPWIRYQDMHYPVTGFTWRWSLGWKGWIRDQVWVRSCQDVEGAPEPPWWRIGVPLDR